ncbi:DUF389 domain-containing protein [Weeksella virosa]|uniref:Hydrophobic domain protein n=1 Tax=Weeksella virosa (strain ATCC 43766 / DSM 16922 / JCM 21250 / CCUG 30538 / CDC 9751 / IAM 14551 / NBRC 16016 / NCTC 11634 / CL345/78) TaxID=865938 RepID=F0NXB5_WEEVC|nr:DUF389 domain-containing protein [Weeksella virosa]ADX66889.1 protein of unknown function DUF389 [Weeksella virosa DSM 16922]VEH63384.1 uncharacterized hydrophobic domain [Weeksella virosa]
MGQLQRLFNLKAGEEDPRKVLDDVYKNISFRGANLWILACAILIASIGLNMNSTAVIIGAMLISPLMGPIVGAGFALATYNFNLLKKSVKNLAIATIVSLLVSGVYFYLSPFKEVQTELLARTSPTIYDVLIAFFGGLVGAISITRVDKGNPIPGVAIATALMPPLCTAGFGLATFDFKFFLGAIYLYTINCFFIGIATFIIIKALKYKPIVTDNAALDKKLRYIIPTLVVLMVLPSFYLAYNLLKEKQFAQNVEAYIQKNFTQKGYTLIYKNINYQSNPKEIDVAFLTKKFDSVEINQLNDDLLNFHLAKTKLKIRQGENDLKSEILSEINAQTNSLSQQEIEINLLKNELKNYQVNGEELLKEMAVLFPTIQTISVGRLQKYPRTDSLSLTTIVLFSGENLEEEKLRSWLRVKLNDPSLEVLQQREGSTN